MKIKLSKIQLIICILCLLAQIGLAQSGELFTLDKSPLPNPTSPVMDYSDVLDTATKQRLETTITEFEKSSNPRVEIGVAIVDTTGERSIFEYSLAVARGWGIGSRDDDNPSALLFIAIKDRKYYTQISKDLEDELPDGVVGSLQRQYLVPQFKRGNYAKGIEDTINAYIDTIKRQQNGETLPTQDKTFDDNEPSGGDCFFICLIIIVILFFIIIANSGGGKGGGGRRKNRNSNVAGDILSGILTGIIIGGSSDSSSSGSSWGGSSGGSSGGGWGGFGGGGDFGGGGAGGGW